MSTEAWSSLILECSEAKTLPDLLMVLVDLPTMRKLASEHGVATKGFRVEKATSKQLAPLLAKESGRREPLREALALALGTGRAPAADTKAASSKTSTPKASGSGDDGATKAMELRLRKAEKKSQREAESAKKARESRQKSLKRLAEVEQLAADLRRERDRLGKQCQELELRAESPAPLERSDEVEDLEREKLGLEERIGVLEEQDLEHRLAEAESLTRIRELEALVQELDSLLPRGQRERIKQFKKSQVEQRQKPSLIPEYGREFLDALERIPDTDKPRIHAALAQVVLGGLEQPGLRVKALKGRGDLLSLRAGIHYRIYFTRSGDKLALHHVGTREEQETFLKNWRT